VDIRDVNYTIDNGQNSIYFLNIYEPIIFGRIVLCFFTAAYLQMFTIFGYNKLQLKETLNFIKMFALKHPWLKN